MRARPHYLLTVFLCLMSSLAGAQAPAFETKAKQAYLIDSETGTVLFSKDENTPVPPASLTKLMTMEVVFDALTRADVTLDTSYTVSEHAWRTGGAPSGTSTMFAALKSSVRVGDLIQGVVVHLANDACIILAEGMAGSESAFAERMMKRARGLGLTVSSFSNPTGLPDPGNTVTMRELVTLARHIQSSYPNFYPLYSQADFEWNKIRQRNRNPLIAANIGVDGLGTGFAEGYGFSSVTSLHKDGKRVFLAMGGLASDKERTEEARKILDWAMNAFQKKTVFAKGDIIGEASVYGGAEASVPLVTSGPVEVLVPVNNPERLRAHVVYQWPLRVPVASGQRVGSLKIWNGERLLREIPVETAAAVKPGSLTSRSLDALQELLFFWL
ncbi:D-alanyl-D-alanine carboxypeptidase family protein [Pararhizobium antarcticum]|uniref:serine-type D-Ala-D-Ala carboxypeptidase n=1 Tax=Pararhizobium antarcticum TaxID=1798805 RepID=A0A657LXD6_9HYPH|nr:D-alanyl-D-alanine carboxypeptidase family protein [Pararhizobium antarcticum]OJF91054.1 D-alanyl-D-alanine carboxypeptidase [Rhizobium sp. 58]OJF99983.1 D-alanyl-D-alanine carboxypeptidase [Pararhizobium antarcticum]